MFAPEMISISANWRLVPSFSDVTRPRTVNVDWAVVVVTEVVATVVVATEVVVVELDGPVDVSLVHAAAATARTNITLAMVLRIRPFVALALSPGIIPPPATGS